MHGSLSSVSYTHLTMSGGISGIFLFAASMLPQILIYLPAWLLLIEWCLRQHEYLFKGNGNGSMTLKQFLPQVPLLACTYAPVSYTHLDVYKRQRPV